MRIHAQAGVLKVCHDAPQVPLAAVNAVGSAVAGTARDADHDSLKSLMSNVTSDYNQVRRAFYIRNGSGSVQIHSRNCALLALHYSRVPRPC